MISRKMILFCTLVVSFAFSIVSPTDAQTLLQITSPSNSSGIPLYQEGQTYTITLWADPSVQNIAVMTPPPLPDAQPTSSPLQFTLTLPTSITPGIYSIGSVGFTSGSDVEAAPVQIDVERQDAPVSISAKPTFVTISPIGGTQPSNVQGTFADGSTLSLKNSALVTYTSDTPSVVTIAANGVMTAVGPGSATITIQYGVLGQSGWTMTTFQVTVPPPPPRGPAPIISSVSPTNGTPGITPVTITGSNFGASQGSGFVQLGNTSATAIGSWTNTQIVATVPSGSMSGVALVNQNGLYSNQIPFTTVMPSITNVSPTSGIQGTQITITGTNFGSSQGSSTILFNGALTNAVSWSNSSITATMSAYATSGNLVVIVNGVPSNAVAFTTTPSITSLAPASGLAGSTVTITGGNFGTSQGASTVTFNGVTATPSAWSATSISAPVPAGAASGPVVVTVNGTASNGSTFTVGQPYDTAITQQFSSTQLVYPGATNVVICVAPATNATATGTVKIYDGTTLLTPQSLQGNGCAYWYIAPGLNAGTHSMTAAYSGDSNNPPGASAPTPLTVSPVPVTLAVSCWNPSFAYGANYQCTANLSSNAGAPQGSITYTFDSGGPVTLTLGGGNAQFTISEPIVGNHQVTVAYAQQTNYAAATPQTKTFTVTSAPVNVALTPSSWYATLGTNLTFTASVTSWSAGPPNANGAISFYDGATLLSTVQVNGSGQASYTTATLPVGTQTITATYAGGANYATGSSTVTITIAR